MKDTTTVGAVQASKEENYSSEARRAPELLQHIEALRSAGVAP
jgi:hypothetical protein